MSRKGLTLAEAAVALFLIAAPLASVMDLSRGTSRGAQADVERLAEEQLIGDALESLILQPVEALRRTASEPGLLFWLMETRVAVCHEAARPAATRALDRLRGELSVELEPRAGNHPELVRVRLTRHGKLVRSRLFRIKRDAVVEALGRRL